MTIIFLNGCTSAGKSSLVQQLQSQLNTPYLLTGIDDALRMIPFRYHNSNAGFRFITDTKGLVQLSFGSFGKATLYAHQVSSAAIGRNGTNLILDEVVLNEQLRLDWNSLLSDIDVFFVGVYCDLEELERRELERGDRMIGQARGQYQSVHQGMVYDYEVDTTHTSPENAASSVIAQRVEW